MNAETTISYTGELSAILTRADGSQHDFGILSGQKAVNVALAKPLSWYEKLWNTLKRESKIPATMGLAAFIGYLLANHQGAALLSVVTTTGVGNLATDFASGQASPAQPAHRRHQLSTASNWKRRCIRRTPGSAATWTFTRDGVRGSSAD